MAILNMSLKDKNGNITKSSGIILHNAFIGFWLLAPSYIDMLHNNGIVIILQLAVLGLLIAMIIISVKNRKITYFWENAFDTYVKADIFKQ